MRLMLVSFIAICTAVLAQDNLIENGDFESGSVTPWVVAGDGGIGEASKNGDFIKGSYSAYLKSASDDPAPAKKKPVNITAPLPTSVSNDQEYTLTFYARGEKDGQAMQAMFYTSPLPDGSHWYRLKEITLEKAWKKYTFSEMLPAAAEWGARTLKIVFQIKYGSFYLDDVSLEPKATPAQRSPARKNLLENAGFDNGVNGWFTEDFLNKLETDERLPEIDHTVKHAGACSLKLYENNLSLISPRHTYVPNQSYTLSFYLRGDSKEGKGVRAFVLTPTWKRALVEIPSSDFDGTWKRYSVTFKEASQGSEYGNSIYFRMDAQSTVWLDSVQLEAGPMTAYDPGPQIGFESEKQDGVFSLGKPGGVIVRAAAGGIAERCVLRVRGLDVSGAERFTASYDMTSDAGMQTFRVPIKTDRPGVIALEALLGTADTARVYAKSEWRYLVTAGETMLTLNPLIGVELNTHRNPISFIRWEETWSGMIGAGFSRNFFQAWYGERSKFVEDAPKYLDAVRPGFQLQRRSGKTLMIDVQPDDDSPISIKVMRKTGKATSEEDIPNALTRYAVKVAAIAAGLPDVQYIELLNEPNIWMASGVKLMPPETYVRVLKAGSEAIRSVGKTKVAANINGMDYEYTEKLFKLGAANYIDAFTVHPYGASPESPPLCDSYRRLRTLIDKYRKSLPVMNSEVMYGTRNAVYDGDFQENFMTDSEEDCAGRILQHYLHGFAADRVPFSLFAPHRNLIKSGISPWPYYNHLFGSLRHLSSVTFGLSSGSEIDVSPSLRLFLFERTDGTKLVTVNTRVFGIRGRMKIKRMHDAVVDQDGNPLAGEWTPVGYLPIYFTFGRNVTAHEIQSAFKAGDYRGFDFPVDFTFDVLADSRISVTMKNNGNSAAKGSLHFESVPRGMSMPDDIQFSIPPAGTSTGYFVAALLPWNEPYEFRYIAQAEDQMTRRSARAPSFAIPMAQAPITIDGDVSDWSDAAWFTLDENALSADFNPRLPHSGPEDLTAKAAFRWASNGFFMAVRVRDQKVVNRITTELAMYNSDSVQVYFDLRGDAAPGLKDYNANDVTYTIGVEKSGRAVATLDHGTGTRFVGENNAPTGVDGDVSVAYVSTASGYVVEAFFPAYTLPLLDLKKGSVMGLSLLVNDNDGDGRKQGVTLGPKGTEPYGYPWLWRLVKLGE
ncbi:MAG: sugar-binding protein [Spirochaetota bacterium]